jgi:hypothetical protein
MSLGLTDDVDHVRIAVASAVSHGIAVVASAGNKPTGGDQYPASYPGVISVTAVDASDGRRAFRQPWDPRLDECSRGRHHQPLRTGPWAPGLVREGQRNFDGRSDRDGRRRDWPWPTSSRVDSSRLMMVVDTSTPIDDLNPTVRGLIGRGRIDFLAAIGNPEPPLEDWEPMPSPSPSPNPFPTFSAQALTHGLCMAPRPSVGLGRGPDTDHTVRISCGARARAGSRSKTSSRDPARRRKSPKAFAHPRRRSRAGRYASAGAASSGRGERGFPLGGRARARLRIDAISLRSR